MKSIRLLFLQLNVLLLLASCNETKTPEPIKVGEVKIGTQTWMSKNLDVEKFRNGDPILEVKSGADWLKAADNQEPAWCYYGNDSKNGLKYGKLYNYYAVIDYRGLAPTNYHIPSDIEWKTLIDFLGAEPGTQLRSTEGFNNNINGSNSSGFTGLPAGVRNARNFTSDFGNIGDYCYWWSSKEINSTDVYCMYAIGIYADFGNALKEMGLSVRCLKN